MGRHDLQGASIICAVAGAGYADKVADLLVARERRTAAAGTKRLECVLDIVFEI